jgi:hypothetical protein
MLFFLLLSGLIAVLSFPQLVRAWNYDAKAPENVAYYSTPLQTKLEYGVITWR